MRVDLVLAERAAALLTAPTSDHLHPGGSGFRRHECLEPPRRAPLARVEDVDGITWAQPGPVRRTQHAWARFLGRHASALRHDVGLPARATLRGDATAASYAAGIVLADLPPTLSPTRISTFTECPRRFKYSAIDRLEEPPTIWTLKGNLVHAALESLFSLPGPQRSRVAAHEALARAAASDWFATGLEVLGLAGQARESFHEDAANLVEKYFRMEDPSTVDVVGVELRIASELAVSPPTAPLNLRGIIDRLDLTEDGLVVVDYKTGRAPLAGRERERLAAVETYALLCERALGQRPVSVRLLYLRDELVVERAVSERELARQERRAVEVWRAIGRAHAAGEFRPMPSRLCAYCAFNDRCEAAPGRAPASEPVSVGSPARDNDH